MAHWENMWSQAVTNPDLIFGSTFFGKILLEIPCVSYLLSYGSLSDLVLTKFPRKKANKRFKKLCIEKM
jgi:hypothetical protein